MRKVGIISLYYKNENYGGLLQAYALTKVIHQLGYSAEQLCWKNRGPEIRTPKKLTIGELFRYGKKAYKKILYLILMRFFRERISVRNREFKIFEEKIPHSAQAYTRDSISKSIHDYDIFVTGSDQVFNMQWYQGEFFLNFVPTEKRKFSYAASMPDIHITKEQKELVKKQLQSFDAISVREKETAEFLSCLTQKNVECLLDPTLLLEKQDWDKICAEPVMKEKYIFCYFLGGSPKARKNASTFAKKMGLKLVTFPQLCGVNVSDIWFGDVRLFNASPEQFISLIKHAEYVFTDSFHAAVFSNIYQTKYYVFERANAKSMSSRITTLLSLMNGEERFCIGKRHRIGYILSLKDKAVSEPCSDFNEIKEKSILFLKQNLSAE